MAPPSADHRAIEWVRPGPGPQRGDQREGRRVGHAGREAADDAGAMSTSIVGANDGNQARRNGEADAQQQQQLAAVPIAERPEPQDRGGQAQRVADSHQVERRLRGVERRADRRQRDVGDRQVQVGDGRHEDQRREDDPPIRRTSGAGRGGAARSARWRCVSHLHLVRHRNDLEGLSQRRLPTGPRNRDCEDASRRDH